VIVFYTTPVDVARHLAQWLVARGETVLDVPSTATARVRELLRGGRRKNDVIDAAPAASVAALQGDASPVPAEDLSTVLSLLEERRANLAAARTRAVNQLHALLRDLVPGGAPTDLSAAAAAGLLASTAAANRGLSCGGVCPQWAVGRVMTRAAAR
jgi:transposase